MQYFAQYLFFLSKTITLVVAFLVVFGGMLGIASKGKSKDRLTIKKINKKYSEMAKMLNAEILPKSEFKQLCKSLKKTDKSKKDVKRKRIFLLDFDGDIRASAVDSLREEITAILNVAKEDDEVVLRLESGGGLVTHYGLAASQLSRIKQHKILLTVIVDKIAASGGYMMACVADKLIAAPFSIIGSIGVVAQMPNFHRLLKKHNVDFEQITAGKYKRTLTLFGENTDKGREKMQEEVEKTHALFKHFITENRKSVDIEQVATGEYWLGSHALELKLVDTLSTSDDYLLQNSHEVDLYHIHYNTKKTLGEKLASSVQATMERMMWCLQ